MVVILSARRKSPKNKSIQTNVRKIIMKVVCVDLDGVLAEYKGWFTNEWQEIGKPIKNASEFTYKLKDIGFKVIIFTTRCNPEVNNYCESAELISRVKNWLEKHNIFYDEIYQGVGKPMASFYIDDNSIRCVPQEQEDAFDSVLNFIKLNI
jgi:HSP90 family molecular chaperone